MIGPTGVGKTEIARRLAKLANAPFIKVEATKFTEVGYVGRDVETIVRDLTEMAVKMVREQAMELVRFRAEEAAEERILDALLPPARPTGFGDEPQPSKTDSATRQVFRKKLREGQLDDKEIDVEVAQPQVGVEIMAPPGMEEMTSQLQNMFSNLGQERKKKPPPEGQGSVQTAHRRGSRGTGQGRRDQAESGRNGGAERYRVPRRNRQGMQALRQR